MSQSGSVILEVRDQNAAHATGGRSFLPVQLSEGHAAKIFCTSRCKFEIVKQRWAMMSVG